jgi:hypothetical protein
MIHDFAKVTVGVIVEADLDDVEIAGGASKVVVVATVHSVTEDVVVVVLVNTEMVEAVCIVKTEDAVVVWSCSMPPFCFSLCEKIEEREKRPDAFWWVEWYAGEKE